MNHDPETIDLLAAQYVLGTLPRMPRLRLERLSREDRDVLEAIWRWERYLNTQIETVTPTAPPTEAWNKVEARLQSTEVATTTRWWWPALSGMLGVLLIISLVPTLLVPTAPPTASAPGNLAVFEDDADQPLWVVSVDMASGTLRTKAINTPARDLDRVFELWMLVDGKPQSLGLLPVSAGSRDERGLSPAILGLLERSSGLAISIEPAGGSPTGQPTGPVVYQAPILEL